MMGWNRDQGVSNRMVLMVGVDSVTPVLLELDVAFSMMLDTCVWHRIRFRPGRVVGRCCTSAWEMEVEKSNRAEVCPYTLLHTVQESIWAVITGCRLQNQTSGTPSLLRI